MAWYSGTTPDARIETCPNAYVVVSTSEDGGKTWNEMLVIHPDAQQTADGTIYLTLDFQRSSEQEILLTSFTEGDVLSASEEPVARVKANRRLVSKGGVQQKDIPIRISKDHHASHGFPVLRFPI